MIKSQIEILEQAQQYLNTVSKADYTSIMSPNFISSAGSHIRHIIDHYLAIKSGLSTTIIDYDIRNRGNTIEQSPQLANQKINDIKLWIKEIKEFELKQVFTLSTEISIKSKKIETVQTTLARELIFAGSHAVHHYAIITQISFAQKAKVDSNFGIAPATATFIKQNSTLSSIN